MDAFEYSCLDQSGKTQTGILQADTEKHVRQILRNKNLIPVKIEKINATVNKTVDQKFNTRLKSGELPVFIRQLSTLLKAGLPLAEALNTIIEQTENKSSKKILITLRSKLMEGHPLAYSMKMFPKAFDELITTSVEAGEQSGNLDEVLLRLAEYLEQRQDMGKQSWMALLYPIILIITSILVVSGLMVYIVPKVIQVFENNNAELPAITKILVSISDRVRKYGLTVSIIFMVLIVTFIFALQNHEFRFKWHRFLLKLPLVGSFIRVSQSARFTRTLGILTKSTVPIVQALSLSGKVINNLVIKNSVEKTASQVREGSSLSQSLKNNGYFPPMTIRLINSGEQSGILSDMLERAADTQERDVNHKLRSIVSVMQPVAILIVGMMILLIVLAMLLPIFQMNTIIT
ncbi:MAG TPA: type II secretion system inner membrane protein GspF [Gammaproteobacteria bacterium]|nr:type II secretion system inner membrane protein GspF [Xanthomonadales bacterium]HOP21316.1 type II secretion system inner membrane protein GspF [Gammaproteobacteria bacterium]HPI94882.1 type II secretion system inner membrane protein GspF [Gammaproteobacteria bacterium]HPQ86475.1 type II secretion system inner membrane protein GspF [Gammaproteobacteria bacterium]